MAGDWIPMRINLAADPDVVAIALTLGLSEDDVTGKLLRFWGWADQHTTDGNARSVTTSWIDKHIGATGFAAALIGIGWLERTEDGVRIPGFDRFLGKSGKTRAKTNRRVAAHREVKRNGNDGSVTKSLPEKRREHIEDTTNVVSSPAVGRGKSKTPTGETLSHAEKLYAAYPRKVARDAALKAIAQALKRVEFPELLEAVTAYAKSRDGKDPNLTPYPATWFNAGRWNDDRSEWDRPDGKAGNRRSERAGEPWENLQANGVHPSTSGGF